LAQPELVHVDSTKDGFIGNQPSDSPQNQDQGDYKKTGFLGHFLSFPLAQPAGCHDCSLSVYRFIRADSRHGLMHALIFPTCNPFHLFHPLTDLSSLRQENPVSQRLSPAILVSGVIRA
jgi:hypothetical protein